MRKPMLTADKVEQEIERLKQSPHVKLSQAERRIKQDRRRKYLADLRWHEKRGKALAELGVSMDNIRAFVEAEEDAHEARHMGYTDGICAGEE